MQQPLNDAQRKFLLIQRLAVIWKVAAVSTALLVVFLILGGYL